MKDIAMKILKPCRAYVGPVQSGEPQEFKKGDTVLLPPEQAQQFTKEGWAVAEVLKGRAPARTKAKGAAPENK